MADDTEDIQALFGLNANTVTGGGGAPRSGGGGVVEPISLPRDPMLEGESDVLRLLNSGSSESSVTLKVLPPMTKSTRVVGLAVGSGVNLSLAHRVMSCFNGMKVSDARAFFIAMGSATQPLNKGDVLDSLESMEVIEKYLVEYSASDFLQSLKRQANKKSFFVPPSSTGGHYLSVMGSKIVRATPDPVTRHIKVLLSDHETRVIPPVGMMDDKVVSQLINDMRFETDAQIETTRITTEFLVRLSLALHPVGVQGLKLVPMAATDHELHVRNNVDPRWKRVVTAGGKTSHVLTDLAMGLTRVVNGRINKFVFTEGEDKTRVFATVLRAVAMGGITVFNQLWEKFGPTVDDMTFVYKYPNSLDEASWQAAPLPEKLDQIAKNKWLPVPALRLIDSFRNKRKAGVLDKLAAFADQSGNTNDARIAQQEKIARVLSKMGIAKDPNAGLRVALGVDMGYTVPMLAEFGFTFADKHGKELYGQTVTMVDVNNQHRLGLVLKGAGCVLSDVADPSTGSSLAGDNLSRCSYMINETLFSNIVNQCVVQRVPVVGIKSYLPNTMVAASALPDGVKHLLSFYDVRAYKTGKLHNDELFYVGRLRPAEVAQHSPEFVKGVQNLVLDYGRICAAAEAGNRLIDYCLSTGTCGPQWHMEGGTLMVSWTHYKPVWRQATTGEIALWRHTSELSPALLIAGNTLPLFGTNRDLYVQEDGQGEDGSIMLQKLFGIGVDPTVVRDPLVAVAEDSQVENAPAGAMPAGDKSPVVSVVTHAKGSQ